MTEAIVLLHGFAGTGRMWEPVIAELDAQRYTALAPDLRGHGVASEERPVDFDAVVGDLLALAPPRFAVAGYSLGGRVALHVALAAPDRVSALGLIATTAGLAEPSERAARRAADEALAARTEAGDIESFLREWSSQPLFAGTPDAAAAAWQADIRRNHPDGLAAALRGLGTGAMASLWERLGELTMPALVLTGTADAKFSALGDRLAAELPDAVHEALQGAGHGLPRERPAEVAVALGRLLARAARPPATGR